MSRVSFRVRNLIYDQMASAFNLNLDNALADYNLDAQNIDWAGIDWTSSSNNFLFGRVNPDAIDESSSYRYPMVTIDTSRSASDPRFKFCLFGGRIDSIIEVHLSWEAEQVLFDFSSWGDAVEDAIYTTMHDDRVFVGQNITFGKDTVISRGAIMPGGKNWRQTITATCHFTLITN